MSSVTDMEPDTISAGHGTAEHGTVENDGVNIETREATNTVETGRNVMSGDGAAGSGDNSFEVIPPQYVPPPGLTESQRAEFRRADQIPISSVASNNGDDNVLEKTMEMFKMMMQQQMETNIQMMKKMWEERDVTRNSEEKGKMKWRGFKIYIK